MSLLTRISIHQTPRKCCECQQPALYWKYNSTTDNQSIDYSSKRPVCEQHCGDILEPAGFDELANDGSLRTAITPEGVDINVS